MLLSGQQETYIDMCLNSRVLYLRGNQIRTNVSKQIDIAYHFNLDLYRIVKNKAGAFLCNDLIKNQYTDICNIILTFKKSFWFFV